MGFNSRLDNSMLGMQGQMMLLPGWVFCTFIASLAGGEFVKASLDCLTPATLAQAAAVLLYMSRRPPNQDSKELRRPAVLALAVLQLLSSVLTLGSLGLAGVSGTYIIRALEPICSCVLLCILHKRRSSVREVVLVSVVVISIWCVVHKDKVPATGAVGTRPVDALRAAASTQGRYSTAVLAAVATVAVSCHSIASKTLATTTAVPELDLFLESSVPGLALAVFLQAALWVLFGISPLQRLWGELPGGAPTVLVSLSTCTMFHCAYNAISFKVLQHCSPVLHAVLNVMKRLVVIMGCVVLTRTPLTAWQVVGIITANIAAALLAMERPAASLPRPADDAYESCPAAPPHTGSCGAALPSHSPLLPGSSFGKSHASAAGRGASADPSMLARLAYIMAVVITSCVLCLGFVLVAFAQAGGGGGCAAARHQAPAQLSPNTTTSIRSEVSDAALRFALRDIQRVQCLQTLHDVSKSILAPFLAGAKGEIALYDVAIHNNLGDPVMWSAAARLIGEFHRLAKVVCAVTQFHGWESMRHFPMCNLEQTIQTVGNGGVIFLHSGGNWGTVWYAVHEARMKYLGKMAQYVKNGTANFRVVQLPQTISVEDDQSYRMASTDSTIAAFPEGFFTFFGRSADSVQYAKQHYPQSTSLPAPDLAWSLGPMMPSAAKVDVLIVMRGDWEAADGERYVDKLLNASQTASDSGSSQGRIAALLRQLTEKNLTYAVRDWDFTPEHGFNAFHETSSVALTQIADSRLQAAIDTASQGKLIITNRLHVSIIANLIGRPVIWMDTKQKKVSGARSLAFSFAPEVCTEENLHAKQATTLLDAVQKAVEWVTSPGFIWSPQQISANITHRLLQPPPTTTTTPPPEAQT